MSKLHAFLTGGPRPIWIRYLLIIGVSTLTIRAILDSQFRHSALLYLAVPFCISIIIYMFVPQPEATTKLGRFARHMLAALIVMFASSALLFEGFICVMMFLPIYLLVAAIVFASLPAPKEDSDAVATTFKSSFIPLLLIIMSVEGLTPSTSFEREEDITHSYIIDANMDTIWANLADPVHVDGNRKAFVSLFPLPVRSEGGVLKPGTVHKDWFEYRRWGLASFNVHKGETHIKIAKVEPFYLETEIVKNDSYISHYLTAKGAQFTFNPISDSQTEITMSVQYTRLLDPKWYFGPMQRIAMGQAMDYFVNDVMAAPLSPKPIP